MREEKYLNQTLFERVVGTSHADELNEVCYPDEITSQWSRNNVEEKQSLQNESCVFLLHFCIEGWKEPDP